MSKSLLKFVSVFCDFFLFGILQQVLGTAVADRYTHQCIHEIVVLGPAAPLLAGRMIGLGVFIKKQRPNSYLVFCVILAIPGWLATSHSFIKA